MGTTFMMSLITKQPKTLEDDRVSPLSWYMGKTVEAQVASCREGRWASPHHQFPSGLAPQHDHRQSTIFTTSSLRNPYVIPTITSWCIGQIIHICDIMMGQPHHPSLQYGTCEYPLILGRKNDMGSQYLTIRWDNHTNNKEA